jgi:hypothetical protein
MPAGESELALRIVVVEPVEGVAVAMQKGQTGKGELAAPDHASPDAVVFDFSIRASQAANGEGPRLLGPFVQGPPDARFVYINWGTMAGDADSAWTRRIKVPLSGLTWPLINALPRGGRLEARIAGRARDGGPACASVPLLASGWLALTAEQASG